MEVFVLCCCAYLFGGSFCTILLYLLVEWKFLYYIALLFYLVEGFVLSRCIFWLSGSFCTISLYLFVWWKFLYYIALTFCLVEVIGNGPN